MEALLQPQPRHANLLLHCGAHAVDREIIDTTSTPEPTITWTPIAHMVLVEEVEQVLKSNETPAATDDDPKESRKLKVEVETLTSALTTRRFSRSADRRG